MKTSTPQKQGAKTKENGIMSFGEFEKSKRKDLTRFFFQHPEIERYGLSSIVYPAMVQNEYDEYLKEQARLGKKLPPVPAGAMSFEDYSKSRKQIVDQIFSEINPMGLMMLEMYGFKSAVRNGLLHRSYNIYLAGLEGKTPSQYDLEVERTVRSNLTQKAQQGDEKALRDLQMEELSHMANFPVSLPLPSEDLDVDWMNSLRNLVKDFPAYKHGKDIVRGITNSPVWKGLKTAAENFVDPIGTARSAYEHFFGNSEGQTKPETNSKSGWARDWEYSGRRTYGDGPAHPDTFFSSTSITPLSKLMWSIKTSQGPFSYLPKESVVQFGPEGAYITVPGTGKNPKDLRLIADRENLLYLTKQDTKGRWQYLQTIPMNVPDGVNPVEFYMTAEKMVDYFRGMPPEKVEKYKEHFKAWIPHSAEIFTTGAPTKMFDGFMKVANKWEKSVEEKKTPQKTKTPAPKAKGETKKVAPALAKRTGTSR